jgi:hypothetical protein
MVGRKYENSAQPFARRGEPSIRIYHHQIWEIESTQMIIYKSDLNKKRAARGIDCRAQTVFSP